MNIRAKITILGLTILAGVWAFSAFQQNIPTVEANSFFSWANRGDRSGGPNRTGSKICLKDGVPLQDNQGNGFNYFCCATNAECGEYNSKFSDGSGNVTCATVQDSPYCPNNTPGNTGAAFVNLMITKGAVKWFGGFGGITMTGASIGENVMYILNIYNQGNTTGFNINVQDVLPPGFVFTQIYFSSPGHIIIGSNTGVNWQIPSLFASTGSHGIATLRYRGYYISTGTKTNTATISSITPVCTTGCTASYTINVVAPLLKLAKNIIINGQNYTGSLSHNQTGAYLITVGNSGAWVASDINISDSLPAEFIFSSTSINTGSVNYDIWTHTISWSGFQVPSGTAQQLIIYWSWNVASSGTITNIAIANNPALCSISGSNCTAQITSTKQAPIDGLCNAGVMISYYSGVDVLPSTGQLCTTGSLQGLVTGNSGRIWNCNGLYGGNNQNACNLQIQYCGDGLLSGSEQCDDNNMNNGDGCSNVCQFEIPTCTLGITPNGGSAPLATTATWNIPAWANATLLDRGDASTLPTPTQPIGHNYTVAGTYTAILTIQNNLSGAITNTCTAGVNVTAWPVAINGLCGSENGNTYYDFTGAGGSLTASSPGLCANGDVINFQIIWHVWTWTCQGINGGTDDTSCNATENYCGDAVLGGGLNYTNQEQCDNDMSNTPGDGCNSVCQFETPTCSFVIAPTSGYAPLNVNLSRGPLDSWVDATELYTSQYSPPISNPISPVNTTYITTWDYITTLVLQNNLPGATNSVQCTGLIQALDTPVAWQCNPALSTGYYSGYIYSTPATGTLCTQGNLTGLVQTSNAWTRSCEGLYGGSTQTACTIDIMYCGDGIVQWGDLGENCEAGAGCDLNTCQRYPGSCAQIWLSVTPTFGLAPLITNLGFTNIIWFSASVIDWGDGNQTLNPTPSSSHTYTTINNFFGAILFENLTNTGVSFACPFIVNTTNSIPANPGPGGIYTPVDLPNSDNNNNNPSIPPYYPDITIPDTNTNPNNPDTNSNNPNINNPDPTNTSTPPIFIPNSNDNEIPEIIIPEGPLSPTTGLVFDPWFNITYIPDIFTPTNPDLPPVYIPQEDVTEVIEDTISIVNNNLPKIEAEIIESVDEVEEVDLIAQNEILSKVGEYEGLKVKPTPDHNSSEYYDIDVASLEYIYKCQNNSYSQDTLMSCVKDLPQGVCSVITKKDNVVTLNKNNIETCLKEIQEYKENYDTVKGSLYIQDYKEDVADSISFLQQFIDIQVSMNIFSPYVEGFARIEFDPAIPNAHIFWLLKKIWVKESIIPVPLFKIATLTPNSQQAIEEIIWSQGASEEQNTLLESLQNPLQQNTSDFVVTYNDPLYSKQTYLQAIDYGQFIKQCNWNDISKKINVAIIDSAFDIHHEDLGTNIAGMKDVADKDDDVTPPWNKTRNTDWKHGTFSAGIIGATSNNEKGVMSIAGDVVNMYLYKAASDKGIGSDIGYGAESLVIAAKNNPQIISLSRGAYINNPKSISFLQKIIDEIHKKGIIIVASAGNYNKSEKFYPAAFDNVISVGAIDNNLVKASFSNYGDWVDIAAPGVDIMTTANGDNYELVDGTSEAAPAVSAVIAKILSKGGTVQDIEDNLKSILEPVGKGAISMGKTCNALALKYDPLSYDKEYSPDAIRNNFEWNFLAQSAIGKNRIALGILLGLLVLWMLMTGKFIVKTLKSPQ